MLLALSCQLSGFPRLANQLTLSPLLLPRHWEVPTLEGRGFPFILFTITTWCPLSLTPTSSSPTPYPIPSSATRWPLLHPLFWHLIPLPLYVRRSLRVTSPTAAGRGHTADDRARARSRTYSSKVLEHTLLRKLHHLKHVAILFSVWPSQVCKSWHWRAIVQQLQWIPLECTSVHISCWYLFSSHRVPNFLLFLRMGCVGLARPLP